MVEQKSEHFRVSMALIRVKSVQDDESKPRNVYLNWAQLADLSMLSALPRAWVVWDLLLSDTISLLRPSNLHNFYLLKKKDNIWESKMFVPIVGLKFLQNLVKVGRTSQKLKKLGKKWENLVNGCRTCNSGSLVCLVFGLKCRYIIWKGSETYFLLEHYIIFIKGGFLKYHSPFSDGPETRVELFFHKLETLCDVRSENWIVKFPSYYNIEMNKDHPVAHCKVSGVAW